MASDCFWWPLVEQVQIAVPEYVEEKLSGLEQCGELIERWAQVDGIREEVEVTRAASLFAVALEAAYGHEELHARPQPMTPPPTHVPDLKKLQRRGYSKEVLARWEAAIHEDPRDMTKWDMRRWAEVGEESGFDPQYMRPRDMPMTFYNMDEDDVELLRQLFVSWGYSGR